MRMRICVTKPGPHVGKQGFYPRDHVYTIIIEQLFSTGQVFEAIQLKLLSKISNSGLIIAAMYFNQIWTHCIPSKVKR